jgi:HEAT repeat protein
MIKLMNDKNENVRRKAAFALGRLAGDPAKTIDVLVKAFKDENDEVREAAGDALSKFGKDAVPPLIDLLKENNAKGRLQASTSLGAIGADAKDAVPFLRERFLAKDSENVHHYAQVLGKIGKPAMPALEAGFKDSRAEVRQAASQAMQQAGADAVGVLVDALGDKNVEVRRLAAQTLWPMRIGDKSVVIALAYGLTDQDDLFRQHCMNALATLGAQAKLAGPKVKEALTDMNPNVRQQAYHLLFQIGEDPRPTLKKALGSEDSKVRINTASLMVQMNVDVNDATPILVDALKTDDLALRMQAASTLASRNLATDKVEPIFIDGVKHKSVSVRIQAVQGLSILGNTGGTSKNGLQAIIDSLKDSEVQVRQQGIYALQNQRGDLSSVLPALVELTKDKEVSIRQQMIWMLQRTGEKGVPHLLELMKDPEPSIRTQSIQVLRNMGPKALEKAVPGLKEATKDKDANVRLQAMIVLASSNVEKPEFFIKTFQEEKDAGTRANLLANLTYTGQQKISLPLMKPAMSDSSAQVRQTAINLLGYYNRDIKEVYEIFEMGLRDSENNVRIQAAYSAGFFGDKSHAPLTDALKSAKDSGFRQAVLQSMQNTSYRSKTALTPLIDCLKDENQTVRHFACNILANIGPDAASALPELRKLADDGNNPGVQQAARNAVARIAPPKSKEK